MSPLRRVFSLLLAVSIYSMTVCSGMAQTNVDWIGTVGSFTDDSNWEPGFYPIAVLDEIGRINNGGTAIVDDEPDPTGGIVLGAGGGDSGRLEIHSGGALTVEPVEEFSLATGSVIVGQSGTGHLVVMRGGTLTAESLSLGGNAASSVVLGESGTGTAIVTVHGAANLNRNLRVVGPDVDFSSESLSLGGTLTSVLTGPTHSTFDVDGPANVGGTLELEFDGHTPSVGESWDLVDATSISGNFASITSVFEPAPGQRFATTTLAGGANGSVLRLEVQQILTLSVDRATGAVSISNLEGGAAIELDGYAVVSPSGSLNPGAWNSLEDQGVSNFEEANPHAGHISELNPLDTAVFTGGTKYHLGDVFSPAPTEFGSVVEDLTLEYARPDGGIVQGSVTYEGIGPSFNNLVLAIDPSSGAGTLLNASPFDIQIDGYAILSPSGALLSGDGEWNSLQDQSVSAWEEANVSANQLAELNPTDNTSLTAGGHLDLGTLFDTAGARDLTLEFFLAGEAAARQGVLMYEAAVIGESVPGDFNDNGLVEQEDLDLVLANWGAPASPPPPSWTNDLPEGNIDQTELDRVLVNWGNTAASLGGTAAVPEPITAVMGVFAAALLGCWRATGCRVTYSRLNVTSQI